MTTTEDTRYCASCGNPASNTDYAKHCCTDDNMITDDTEEE